MGRAGLAWPQKRVRARPTAKQLSVALKQAGRHFAAGRVEAAPPALQRFAGHLDHPTRPDTLTPEAAAGMRAQIDLLLKLLG